jgi:prevent-host-death family protein
MSVGVQFRSWSGIFHANLAGARPSTFAYVSDNPSTSERRISEARESFSTTINHVTFGGERVVLTRHGKRVAAVVVPIEDLELIEALEDARDLDDVRAALADPDNRERIAWDDLKAQLGL